MANEEKEKFDKLLDRDIPLDEINRMKELVSKNEYMLRGLNITPREYFNSLMTKFLQDHNLGENARESLEKPKEEEKEVITAKVTSGVLQHNGNITSVEQFMIECSQANNGVSYDGIVGSSQYSLNDIYTIFALNLGSGLIKEADAEACFRRTIEKIAYDLTKEDNGIYFTVDGKTGVNENNSKVVVEKKIIENMSAENEKNTTVLEELNEKGNNASSVFNTIDRSLLKDYSDKINSGDFLKAFEKYNSEERYNKTIETLSTEQKEVYDHLISEVEEINEKELDILAILARGTDSPNFAQDLSKYTRSDDPATREWAKAFVKQHKNKDGLLDKNAAAKEFYSKIGHFYSKVAFDKMVDIQENENFTEEEKKDELRFYIAAQLNSHPEDNEYINDCIKKLYPNIDFDKLSQEDPSEFRRVVEILGMKDAKVKNFTELQGLIGLSIYNEMSRNNQHLIDYNVNRVENEDVYNYAKLNAVNMVIAGREIQTFFENSKIGKDFDGSPHFTIGHADYNLNELADILADEKAEEGYQSWLNSREELDEFTKDLKIMKEEGTNKNLSFIGAVFIQHKYKSEILDRYIEDIDKIPNEEYFEKLSDAEKEKYLLDSLLGVSTKDTELQPSETINLLALRRLEIIDPNLVDSSDLDHLSVNYEAVLNKIGEYNKDTTIKTQDDLMRYIKTNRLGLVEKKLNDYQNLSADRFVDLSRVERLEAQSKITDLKIGLKNCRNADEVSTVKDSLTIKDPDRESQKNGKNYGLEDMLNISRKVLKNPKSFTEVSGEIATLSQELGNRENQGNLVENPNNEENEK